MIDWILTAFPAPFWTTALTITIVGAVAAIAGWSLGFDQGRDLRLKTPAELLATQDRMPDAVDTATLESAAFHRGVEAGVVRERARQREVRSKAGLVAAQTAKLRRNRVTGQVLPSTPGLNGTTTSGTVGTLAGVAAHNADAGEGEE